MPATTALATMLGDPRHQVYLHAAAGDADLAVRLYLWGADLAGAWHAHLSHVEISVRNALDRELRKWNTSQITPGGSRFPSAWTSEHGAAPLLYDLIGPKITRARRDARRAAEGRASSHPRHGQIPNHDDVVAQLMFGAWTQMLRSPGSSAPNPSQRRLWEECLHRAFPGASPDPRGLSAVGGSLEALRVLRNRVAHHENLLGVDTPVRLRESLMVLSHINPALPTLVMGRNRLRLLHREDPRRHR